MNTKHFIIGLVIVAIFCAGSYWFINERNSGPDTLQFERMISGFAADYQKRMEEK